VTLEAGAVLGRYRVESLIGRGGMGAVYLATDTQLDRPVAFKVLSPELTDDGRFRDRFMAESRIAASLDHPNIVPVYEAGEIDGQLFIAMRYIDGQDLSDVLAARGALSIALAVRIVTAVAAALDAAHAKGLVHRDVKPGNVLLAGSDEAPHVYLTDFGLTKRIGDASMTAAGQIVGSIGYVAPEQVEGRPVDARTDVYSLGCLAYEILVGAQPFRRDSEMAVLMAHVADPPPSLLASRPELPEALDAAVAQAMAKDPGARFASAGEFAAALSEAMRPEGGAITRGFLFADLRGYTAYVEGHGDPAASALLDIYRRMMRDTIARHGGAEIKTEGDSFYVVFPSASGAVMCGLSVVAAAAAQSHADPEHPIRVGVGVNAGEAVAAAEGYVGSAVNIAARVCAQAKPGEVLVTETVRGLTRTSGRLTFVPVGRRTLKGIAEPMPLFRAEPAGSGLLTAPGGAGPFWRRPAVLAGGGGGLVLLALAAFALKGGFGPPGASPSAAGSVAPSVPAAELVDRIAYTQVRSFDPTADPSCGDMAEGRAFLLDPAGGVPVRIKRGGDESETHLAWSRDGALAYVGSQPFAGQSVYRMDVLTGGTTNLLPDARPEGLDPGTGTDSISWSPEGTSLVFAWGGEQVWAVGADGNGLHSLAITMPPGYALGGSAVLLADGRIAALVSDINVQFGTTLAIASGPGGVLTPVPWMPAGLTLAAVGWSPDRSQVAFVGADVSALPPDALPTWDLYAANADGSDSHKVTSVQVPDGANAQGYAAWSPDGTQIVFGSGTLHIVNADGGEVRELPGTPGRAACWPSWGRTTTALLPQPTPTLAPGATPAPQPFHEGLLDPGVYVTDVFRPEMRLEVGQGWEGLINSLDQLIINYPGISRAELDVDRIQLGYLGSCLNPSNTKRPLTGKADVMAFLQGHPNLKVVGSPAVFNSPGLRLSGLSVEIEVSTLPTEAECPRDEGLPPQHEVPLFEFGSVVDVLPASQRARVIAFDAADGGLLAFIVYAPKDQYGEFNYQAEQILKSLAFP
jgi:serine/threonine-protein kinase